ncbi:MAG: 50S ribosomal protein L15 [Chlamydiota bacterium]
MKLSELKNTHRRDKNRKRVGRGPGSKRGKTCCRGHKGAKSRSGYKQRGAHEGGGLPLFQRVPKRGFSQARFARPYYAVNLGRLDVLFDDGESVNVTALLKKGISRRRLSFGLKILGNGELTKKVVIEAHSFSRQALRKLEAKGIEFKRTS